jgi:hypothetical protein
LRCYMGWLVGLKHKASVKRFVTLLMYDIR